jgi:hypothetical protein
VLCELLDDLAQEKSLQIVFFSPRKIGIFLAFARKPYLHASMFSILAMI